MFFSQISPSDLSQVLKHSCGPWKTLLLGCFWGGREVLSIGNDTGYGNRSTRVTRNRLRISQWFPGSKKVYRSPTFSFLYMLVHQRVPPGTVCLRSLVAVNVRANKDNVEEWYCSSLSNMRRYPQQPYGEMKFACAMVGILACKNM